MAKMFDSLILLIVCGGALPLVESVPGSCREEEHIQCASVAACVRYQYMCDGDLDCSDGSDEDPEICSLWLNQDCGIGEARCKILSGDGYCERIERYCQPSTDQCLGTLDQRICYLVNVGRLMPLNKVPDSALGDGSHEETDLDGTLSKVADFEESVKHSIKHEECPELYTKVGEHCLSFLFFGNLTWAEARSFCQTFKGDLFTPEDAEDFHTLVHHMKTYHMTSDFWIGGNFNKTWKWTNGKAIELGTPLWALRHNRECDQRDVYLGHTNKTVEANNGQCYFYSQAPMETPEGHCVAATYDKFYFLSDENCLSKKAPLCKLEESE